MTTPWKYAPAIGMIPANSVVGRTLDSGAIESRSVRDPEVAAWIAAGNVPLPADDPALQPAGP